MRFHLVLVFVLCFSITKSLVAGKILSTVDLAKKLTNANSLKCFLTWLSRLVNNSAKITLELGKCVKNHGEKSVRVLDAYKNLLVVAAPILLRCKKLIGGITAGGPACLKAFALNSFSLIRALNNLDNARNSEPQSKTKCSRDALKDYFGSSNLNEIFDGCL
ncbi:uncharacterized protein LOC117582771 [Drosophila guanche]|uniref:uncharacterized protein LOC117582771 n=1 Tax=Drosophila guanche TaxID=7266 RepID=UPI001471F395|nr:uncharacterized protein LOC117582771 [Drosophila guanche]